jgi:enterochelin esterase-like enzyme
MQSQEFKTLFIEKHHFQSKYLSREVILDFYVPQPIEDLSSLSLLLINDGQNLAEMHFAKLLDELVFTNQLQPLMCVGIHANEDRKHEYGTAKVLNYLGQGKHATAFQLFVTEELLSHAHIHYGVEAFARKGFAGFSLGGLSALDTVWNHPQLFSLAGVFSGSLWWRNKGLEDGYNEATDRIMHQLVKKGSYQPHLKFLFTTGSLDETDDRNNNGIIDSIDDTLGLIEELRLLGYREEEHIKYINYEDGRHDIATWGRAMPHFLLWGFGKCL